MKYLLIFSQQHDMFLSYQVHLMLDIFCSKFNCTELIAAPLWVSVSVCWGWKSPSDLLCFGNFREPRTGTADEIFPVWGIFCGSKWYMSRLWLPALVRYAQPFNIYIRCKSIMTSIWIFISTPINFKTNLMRFKWI